MAHFAYVVDGIVQQVHVVANDVLLDENGDEDSSKGQELLAQLYGYSESDVIQCSYNGSFRKNYPGPGWSYDAELDAFIDVKPYESWVLDDATCSWVAPVPYPNDNAVYAWSEHSRTWVEV